MDFAAVADFPVVVDFAAEVDFPVVDFALAVLAVAALVGAAFVAALAVEGACLEACFGGADFVAASEVFEGACANANPHAKAADARKERNSFSLQFRGIPGGSDTLFGYGTVGQFADEGQTIILAMIYANHHEDLRAEDQQFQ